MAGLVPAIHVFPWCHAAKTWMPGTRLVLGPAKPDPSAGHDSLLMTAQPRIALDKIPIRI
jgi:hypothetical protein